MKQLTNQQRMTKREIEILEELDQIDQQLERPWAVRFSGTRWKWKNPPRYLGRFVCHSTVDSLLGIGEVRKTVDGAVDIVRRNK